MSSSKTKLRYEDENYTLLFRKHGVACFISEDEASVVIVGLQNEVLFQVNGHVSQNDSYLSVILNED